MGDSAAPHRVLGHSPPAAPILAFTIALIFLGFSANFCIDLQSGTQATSL